MKCIITNKTNLPNKELAALIRKACRRAECTDIVHAEILNPNNRSRWIHGRALYRESGERFAGFIVRIPNITGCVHIAFVRNLYWVFVHEAKHVADSCAGRSFDYRRRHDNQPHERRANITATLALRAAKNGSDPVAARAIEALAKKL
jgi:hypothetical protein